MYFPMRKGKIYIYTIPCIIYMWGLTDMEGGSPKSINSKCLRLLTQIANTAIYRARAHLAIQLQPLQSSYYHSRFQKCYDCNPISHYSHIHTNKAMLSLTLQMRLL